MKYTFLPQSVPAYSATEVFNDLRKKHTEYGYKEAVLNPTNPRNRAVDWEADVITQFRGNERQDRDHRRARHAHRPVVLRRAPDPHRQRRLPALPQHGGRRAQDDGRALRPGQRLRLEPQRGGRRADHLGADAGAAGRAPTRPSPCSWRSIGACSCVIGVVLNLMLWTLVIRPVGKLSQLRRPREPGRARRSRVQARTPATRSACWRARSGACARAWCRR